MGAAVATLDRVQKILTTIGARHCPTPLDRVQKILTTIGARHCPTPLDGLHHGFS
jgi:hypothetical protein